VHDNAVSAPVAIEIKNAATLFAKFTGHAAFIAPRITAALKS
jgi:hypothetical protein